MTSPRETVLCQYHYDPLDRLISHALTDTLERQRFYCKSRLATEIQGAMRYSIVQHGEQLLAQQRSEGDAAGTTLLATDQQRSVLQAFKANHPRQIIAYSPYGHRPLENGLLSLLGFNGERPDPVTGCYLLGNGRRTFNPVLMRFTSPDSLSPFEKGGLNPYAYCLGDPINRSDPNGQFSFLKLAQAFITRKTNIYNGGALVKIRPGVSTLQAMRARDEMLNITKTLDHYKELQNIAYKEAYKNKFLHSPTRNLNLQNNAIYTINSHQERINLFFKNNAYPSKLKTAINNVSPAREYLVQNIGYTGQFKDLDNFTREYRFPESLLHRNNNFAPAVNIANDYIAKIDAIRAPNESQLLDRFDSLRNLFL
ncbi:RHS repeat-associated core domain-containing protein [Pseudomonas silesiensis]|uniref:RHS repeat-associated core domain-containing protein n=1 Tax=Pseudomonas silesiensis TaxID=1853130 RepID=UPI0009EECBD3|nr:RHS repeat-associated core domain-containing protein [Pseudomonas silesiensis]